jgi:hypothetical protein
MFISWRRYLGIHGIMESLISIWWVYRSQKRKYFFFIFNKENFISIKKLTILQELNLNLIIVLQNKLLVINIKHNFIKIIFYKFLLNHSHKYLKIKLLILFNSSNFFLLSFGYSIKIEVIVYLLSLWSFFPLTWSQPKELKL